MKKNEIFCSLVTDLNEKGIATLNWGMLADKEQNVENLDDATKMARAFILSGFNVYKYIENGTPTAIHITIKARKSKNWVKLSKIK